MKGYSVADVAVLFEYLSVEELDVRRGDVVDGHAVREVRGLAQAVELDALGTWGSVGHGGRRRRARELIHGGGLRREGTASVTASGVTTIGGPIQVLVFARQPRWTAQPRRPGCTRAIERAAAMNRRGARGDAPECGDSRHGSARWARLVLCGCNQG